MSEKSMWEAAEERSKLNPAGEIWRSRNAIVYSVLDEYRRGIYPSMEWALGRVACDLLNALDEALSELFKCRQVKPIEARVYPDDEGHIESLNGQSWVMYPSRCVDVLNNGHVFQVWYAHAARDGVHIVGTGTTQLMAWSDVRKRIEEKRIEG